MTLGTRVALKFGLFTGAIAALTALSGPAIGLGLGFVIATVAWGYGNTRLNAMFRWLSAEPGSSVPQGQGLWDEAFSLLYRQQRAQSQQIHQITQSLVSFRRAAQAMPDGVIILNQHNQIVWCNDTAAQMLGLNPQRDSGHAITNLVRNPELSAFLEETEWTHPLTLRVTRESTRIFQVQMVEYGESQRLMQVRDITQIERLETMRRDFVANVSHELKTPLTVLAGFLETLREHSELPDPQKQHFLDLMHEQSVRMRRLVEELLQLSALESNTVAPRDPIVEMDPLMQRLERSARSLSAGRHTITFDTDQHVAVSGADTELASAFENLISNAIRYTPEGGRVDVRLQVLMPSDGREPVMKFSVSDTGIGIEAHHLPRLTERFYRVDRSRSRESGGTGLGMAIVKHVLTRHDGQLKVESSYGSGTTMTAVLPASRIIRVGVPSGAATSASPVTAG
jgi:two-component system phosphate regulon sensor histidine kinase PhoR